jgi:S-adenosyl-L-methionine hydrolase (adenosine-forming)
MTWTGSSRPSSGPPFSLPPVVITFLSDFGLQDDFVGTCHGVMKRIAPEAEIIDITHGIPPQHVLQGALVLCNTLRYMPEGVHLAVVDPGVGGHRRPLALRTGDGRYLVGPDNGLLMPATDGLGGVAAAYELANPEFALDTVSRTFHGRDLFSPAAAHLARGVALEQLGPPIDQQALVRIDIPSAEVGQNRIRATVLYVDHFGNIQLNLTREHLEQADVLPGVRVELEILLERYYAVAARTYADARPGDIILYEDAYGNVAIAISGGSAAEMFAVGAGQEVRIHLRAP